MTRETFEASLQRRLGDPHALRYRVRETRYGTYAIEQQVARSTFEGWDTIPSEDLLQGDGYSEERIRVRDGYALVMEVSPSSTLKCEGCGFFFDLVPLRWKEYRCAYCLARGEKQFYYVAYFPLSEKLLEQLAKTSPARAHEFNREMEARNRAKRASAYRSEQARLEDIAKDYFNSSAGFIPRVGLSGGRQHNDRPAHHGAA